MKRESVVMKGTAIVLVLLLCSPAYSMGLRTAAGGVGMLILSPFMIASGLAEGLAMLPYTLSTDLHQLNRGLMEAQATTLDEAYRSVYGVGIDDGRVDPQTGRVEGTARPFRSMLDATYALQKLLGEKGMDRETASHYILCSIDSHTRSRGHILLSVVYRHAGMNPIRVVHKHSGIVRTLRPSDPAWREPYRQSVEGELIDEVIDWAGLENRLLDSHKVVGMLMVTASESILAGKRMDNYWETERQWMSGQTDVIIEQTKRKGLEAINKT